MSAASSSRAAKLAKLQQFKANLPSHTQAALHAMVEEAKNTGLPELSRQADQVAARRQLLDSCHGGHLGPLIETASLVQEDCQKVKMFFCHPLVYLASLFARGSSFTKLIQEMHAIQPSSHDQPWDLILYADEIIPGNVLGRAERKTWCVYTSFLQFKHHLCHEEAWLTIACERSNWVSSLEAGVSQMVRAILRSIFQNDFVQPAILLKHPTGDTKLHFRLSMVLADGAAHKQIWGSKGDAGTKFCILCANIKSTDPPILKHDQLVLTTDQEVVQSYQKLHTRQAMTTKKDFEMWQQATGWTYSKEALLLDSSLLEARVLKPVSQFCHDYMHGILQGTAPVVLYHCLCAINEHIDVWQFLEGYFPFWNYPKAWNANHVASLFSKKRVTNHKNNAKFSCQASECLALFAIVRFFIHKMVLPKALCIEACQAFLAMASVIDQIHVGIPHQLVTKATLLITIEKALASFTAAFSDQPLIKKWHWMLHLADSYQRYNALPSCFTCERKHKTISGYATNLHKTTNFERSLLEQVVCNEICTLDQPSCFPSKAFVLHPKKASKNTLKTLSQLIGETVSEALGSHVARLPKGGYISKGDVVFFKSREDSTKLQIGQVQMHFLFNDVATTLIQVWKLKTLVASQEPAMHVPSC